jgi:hypothetical protein
VQPAPGVRQSTAPAEPASATTVADPVFGPASGRALKPPPSSPMAAALARALAGATSDPPPVEDRRAVQQATGGTPEARVRRGPGVDAVLLSWGARAATVGRDVLAPHPSRTAPALMRHELAHVVQSGGRDVDLSRPVSLGDPAAAEEAVAGSVPGSGTSSPQVVRRMTDFQYDVAEERRERRRQAEEAARKRTEAWRGVVTGQVAGDLQGQGKDLKTDIGRTELAVASTRANLYRRVEKFLPEHFVDDWATARLAVELMGAALAPDEKGVLPESVPFDVQELVREKISSFYLSLRSWEVKRYQAAVASAQNNYQVWRMNQMVIVGTRFADRRPPPEAIAPPPPNNDVRQRGAVVHDAQAPIRWRAVLTGFEASSALADSWAAEMVPKDSPELQALQQAAGLYERQQDLLKRVPNARKVQAVFYPKDEYDKSDDKDKKPADKQRATAYPWFFYLYKKPNDPDWYLEDVTARKFVNVHDQTAQEGAESFARSRYGLPDKVDPPEELWEQLNSKLRFPEGELHIVLPSGKPYRLETTAETSLAEYLGYAALAVGVLAMVLGTAGAGTPAAIALVASVGLGIAGTVAGLHELEEQGIATDADRAKAALMIVVDLSSLLTLGLGKIAKGAATAGELASAGAKLAGRLYVPVARLSVGLELTQLYIVTEQFVDAYRAVSNQPGLTDDQRSAAQRKIVLMGLATGALSLWSIRGTLKDIQTYKQISSDQLLPPASGPVKPPPTTGAPTPGPQTPARAADLRLGRAQLVEGAQVVDTMATGTIQIELRRNKWGLVSEIAIVHGPPPTGARSRAFAADLAHHQQIAQAALKYSGLLGEIRELLERIAAKLTGRPRGPYQLELELSKLEGRIQDRLARIEAEKHLGHAEVAGYEREIESFRKQIQGHRDAIAKGLPPVDTIAQQGTPAGHPDAPAGYVYHFDTVRQRWDVVPQQAGPVQLRVGRDPTGAPTGRFSNAEQLDAAHIDGLSASDPTAAQRLASLGYVVDSGKVRPAPGVPPDVAKSMLPLRLAGDVVQITPQVHLGPSTLGKSAYYKKYQGMTLDAETMVEKHGTSRQVWTTDFEPVGSALKRAGAETLWKRGSRYGLIDYIRYHLFGPGTGKERFRIFLAPEEANQFANNQIEGYMRRLRDGGSKVKFRVSYQTFSGPELRSFIDHMLESGDQKLLQMLARDGGNFERLLKFARYDIEVTDAAGLVTKYKASVEMGPPGPNLTGTVTKNAPTLVTQF